MQYWRRRSWMSHLILLSPYSFLYTFNWLLIMVLNLVREENQILYSWISLKSSNIFPKLFHPWLSSPMGIWIKDLPPVLGHAMHLKIHPVLVLNLEVSTLPHSTFSFLQKYSSLDFLFKSFTISMNHLSWKIDKVIVILASTSSMWKASSLCQMQNKNCRFCSFLLPSLWVKNGC